MPARFPKGTLARIDAVLSDREKRSDFIREAVEKEIERIEGVDASDQPGTPFRKRRQSRRPLRQRMDR